MSYQRFMDACKQMKQFTDFEFSGGRSDIDISQAEIELGLRFSRQCRAFIKEFDYVSFDGNEIFGIVDGASSPILEGNLVAYTKNDRALLGLPAVWIPFYNFGDGTMAYYDYSVLNEDQEPRIIRAIYNPVKKEFAVIERLAEDFGEFLFQLVSL